LQTIDELRDSGHANFVCVTMEGIKSLTCQYRIADG